MKNIELLSPAGSYESALAAIQNGCDAIYMAGPRFGARAYATNFDETKMQEIITYAHGYGVKVYITINTLVHDEELQDCIQYIDFLYHANVDALIIQDLGILDTVRQRYPDFEVHASTQMHVNNKESLHFLKQMGVHRAVLAREVELHEFEELSQQGMELEVFVHGALCVAYSGQCLFSAMLGDRSGNRGQCAQGCRMPYTLIDDDKKVYAKGYLLSLKDLHTVDIIPQIVDSGVTSLKLEGRMKKSQYVASITKMYREALDHALLHKKYKVSNALNKQNKIMFNRGYTKGFMLNALGSQLSNSIRPNHMGIEIGSVIQIKNQKIKIKLTDELHQHDGIRFLMEPEDVGCKVNRLYLEGLLVNFAPKYSVIELDHTLDVKIGAKVIKTSDYYLEKQIQSEIEQAPRTVAIQMHFKAQLDKPLLLEVTDGKHHICVQHGQASAAVKLGSTQELIYKQLSKTSDTIFSVQTFTCELESQLFIVNKHLNELRRLALQKLYEARIQKLTRQINNRYPLAKQNTVKVSQLLVTVQNEAQLQVCMQLNIPMIFIEDIDIYNKYKQYANVYLRANKATKTQNSDVTLIQELGGLVNRESFICDTGIHVYNANSALLLQHLGAGGATLSLELNKDEIATLMRKYLSNHPHMPLIQVIYGRVEVMVSKHCPINASILDNQKQNCTLCRGKLYALQDKYNNVYPMLNDAQCNMHLYDFKVRNEISLIPMYQELGIHHFRFDFTDESPALLKRTLFDILGTVLG